MTKISQREAHRLRKRVDALESAIEHQRRAWSQEYFGGTQIGSARFDPAVNQAAVAIRTARKLGHAVVCIGDDSHDVRFVALPHPAVTK